MGMHADFRTQLWNREEIEDEIERLITLLDAVDGDWDLEEGNDMEAVNEDGVGELSPVLPRYGADQSIGPINERECYLAWQHRDFH